ncbi:MAG: alpha/beta hydrolase [Pseudomonadota bacterium]|nr:alpha/beta hydrolase [Pseudomonadota bacterium]
MSDINNEILKVNNVDLTLCRAGKGDPLLLLHGANGNSSWLPVVDELAENFDVILPDHPGFGDTKPPEWMDNISDMAYFYLDAIEALEIDTFHIAGHSMGGWLAAEIGIRNSQRIKSLTLVSAAGIWVNGTPIGDLFSWSPEETAHQLFAQQSFIDEMLSRQPDEEEIDLILRNRQMAARLCWAPRLHNPDLRKWLHRLKIPTLIIWGDSDGIFPEVYAHTYHELIRNSELQIYKNCGHVPMIEARDAFLNKFASFILGAN